MTKKVLILHVSEPWYSMIASGEKNEEYREIKPYWLRRITKDAKGGYSYIHTADGKFVNATLDSDFRSKFTHAIIVKGYPKDNIPHIEKEIESITIGKPQPGLCPKEFENKDYFIIKFK